MTIIKQVYNARYLYKKSKQGDRIEMQQLMMLLEQDMYVQWSKFEEGTNVVQDLFWTYPNSMKLLNAFNIVLMMDTKLIGIACPCLKLLVLPQRD